MPGTCSKEVSVECVMREMEVSERQAEAIRNWVIATRTKKMSKSASAAEALSNATHQVKIAFDGQHDKMLAVQHWARCEFNL